MMELSAGCLLQGGKYKIVRTLGRGGFGITYLGEQVALGRHVAIKEFFMSNYCERDKATSCVSMGISGSREMVLSSRKKFIKEAQTIATLKHPNIIAIYDIFEENNTAYYVMEYIDGGSLNEKIGPSGMSEELALSYIRQVADALNYLHARLMNHLDVKPGNVLITPDDRAVLIDFGLTKHYDDEGLQTTSTPVGVSHGYAPVEQYMKGGISTFSASTDIYSLGATLYKALVGVAPPAADKVREEGLPPLPSHISQATRHAVICAMQPRRSDRPRSVAEFLALITDKSPHRSPADEETHLDAQHTEANTQLFDYSLGEGKTFVDDKGEGPRGFSIHDENTHIHIDSGSKADYRPHIPFGKKRNILIIITVVLAVVAALLLLLKYSLPAISVAAVAGVILLGVLCEKILSLMHFSVNYRAAEQGKANAQYSLANYYFNGKNAPRNLSEAVLWYSNAARQEHAQAQFMMGHCCENGYGVERDMSKAVQWYHKAAKQGHAMAQNKVGCCCLNGYGVAKDYAEAVKWFGKAAEMDYPPAQSNLGYCYSKGWGVPQNLDKAMQWWTKAAKAKNTNARYLLGFNSESIYGEDIDDHCLAAALSGHPLAQYRAACYYNGSKLFSKKNVAKLFYFSAMQGCIEAQHELALCYFNGYTGVQDLVKAVLWLREAAEQGYARSQYLLGDFYRDGIGVEQNYAEAARWYRCAAEQGDAKSQYLLGFCYEHGTGVAKDTAEAVRWYSKAAEQGDAESQYLMGYFYRNGIGVKQNYAEAVRWYSKAAEQGHAKAMKMLKKLRKEGYE